MDKYPRTQFSHSSVSVEEIIADNDDTKPTEVLESLPQRFLPSRESSRPKGENVTCTTITSLVESKDERIAVTPVDAQPFSDQNKSDNYASKMPLVTQLACTDSHGRPLGPIQLSVKGRNQPLSSDDDSLQPASVGRTAALTAVAKAANQIPDTESDLDDKDQTDQSEKPEKSVEPSLLQRLAQQKTSPDEVEEKSPAKGKMTPEQALAKLFGRTAKADDNSKEDASPGPGPSGSGRARSDSDGFASSVGVISKLMKWTTKTKAVSESLEKYPGHLRDVRDRGRTEKTELPLPLMILVKQESLPIIHNLAKAYKVAMGKNHKLTKEAFARYEELKSELTGAEVFL